MGFGIFFTGIFDDASDRARIFAIVLSAFLVFFGIWYTQWQTDRRERLTFYRKNLASTFKQVLEVENEIHLLLDKVHTSNLQGKKIEWDVIRIACGKAKELDINLRLNFPKTFGKSDKYIIHKRLAETSTKTQYKQIQPNDKYYDSEEYTEFSELFSDIQWRLESLAAKC